MAEVTIIALSDRQYDSGSKAINWANTTAWDTIVGLAAAELAGEHNPNSTIVVRGTDGNANITRPGLVFDTTVVPSGAIVSDVRFKIYGAGLGSAPWGPTSYQELDLRICTLDIGDGTYNTLANYAAVRAGTLVAALPAISFYSGPDGEEEGWWTSQNMSALFTRSASFCVGVMMAYDSVFPIPDRGWLTPNIIGAPIGDDEDDYTIGTTFGGNTLVGYEPQLVVTYELPVRGGYMMTMDD